jgi:hypothetical protein
MTYREAVNAANPYRVREERELADFIARSRQEAERDRTAYFQPDCSSEGAYTRSSTAYREDLVRMLGWPLCGMAEQRETPEAVAAHVAREALCDIWRLEIAAARGLTLYGLLFLPPSSGPHHLVVVQHGGSGTPEWCAGFNGESNYNGFIARCLQQGRAVFAPQLYLWAPEHGTQKDRAGRDSQLKQLGGSLAALEIFKLRRGIDYLLSRPDIIGEKLVMAGLSYGGFYTLFTAAVDLRIKGALVSCFVNDRFRYDWPDWTWFNAGRTLLDAEIAALICPRPLFLELGSEDELFGADTGVREAEKIGQWYARLGCQGRFRTKVFQGMHEFDKEDDGLQFLLGLQDG